MSVKFKLKEDWTYEVDFMGIKEKQILFAKGHIFEPNESGLYIIKLMNDIVKEWDLNDMRNNVKEMDYLLEEIEDLTLNISEIQNEDDEVKSWRIQLDIKTSFKNLKKIENFLRENIPYYL